MTTREIHRQAKLKQALSLNLQGRLRKGKRRVPKVPRSVSVQYLTAIREILDTIRDYVNENILPLVRELPSLRKDAVSSELQNKFNLIKVKIASEVNEPWFRVSLNKVGQRVSEYNLREMSAAIGINLRDSDATIAGFLDRFRRENVGLISSMATRYLEQVEEVIANAQNNALRVEEVGKQISERFGVAESHAVLIARDQVLKANADLSRERQRAVGIEEYIWSTSNDERVRSEHEELDGTRQRWDTPPVFEDGTSGHPGEPILCRCVAIPVLPWEGVEDA